MHDKEYFATNSGMFGNWISRLVNDSSKPKNRGEPVCVEFVHKRKGYIKLSISKTIHINTCVRNGGTEKKNCSQTQVSYLAHLICTNRHVK